MRSLAVALAIALAALPLAASLPAPGPAAPGAGALAGAVPEGLPAGLPVDPAMYAAAVNRDVAGLLAGAGAMPGVTAVQRAALDTIGRAYAAPTLDNLVAIGEQHWLGGAQASPELTVPGLRAALLGLYEAAGAAPDAAALEAIADLETLPPEAAHALARLAAAQTYALAQARLAFAGLTPEEYATLRLPVNDQPANAKVRWDLLFLGLRAQLDAAESAAPVLGLLAPRATVLQSCDVVLIDLDAMDDAHGCDHLLSVDLGGDDVYTNNAGGTGFGELPNAALLLDLAGDDRYEPMATGTAGLVGGAVMGTAVLYDAAGADVYRPVFAQGTMQGPITGAVGGGSEGLGALVDRDGADVYEVVGAWYAGVQGGSRQGYGLLYDGGPQGDSYYADLESAGGAHGGADRGAAVLVDLGGSDTYLAMIDTRVGVEAGFAGGALIGTAALLDYGTGHDVYESHLMGPMASGGFNGGALGINSVGVLIDQGGNDRHYNMGMMDSEANGSGGAGGLGVLLDLGGMDHSSGVADMTGAVNGASDGGIGVYVNVGGNDVYEALFCNPGTGGINGGSWAGSALLLDVGGLDAYRDRIEHHMHHHATDGAVMECMMMMPMGGAEAPGAQGNYDSGWRYDTAQVGKGVGSPLKVPTGAQVDDSARRLLPPDTAIMDGPLDPMLPDLSMTTQMLLGTDPAILATFAEALGPRGAGPSTSYKPHAPAVFRSIRDFTAANGVKGGMGTAASPFVISGWAFTTALAPGAEAGLVFEGTDLHVRVVDNVFPELLAKGVVLRGAKNVVLERNACILATDCFELNEGSHAVLRSNLALRAAFGIAVYDSSAEIYHNDIAFNAEGINFRNAHMTVVGNEFLGDRDSFIGRGGTSFLRDNNFRLSGTHNFHMRNAIMVSDHTSDICGNWYSHPMGPMVMEKPMYMGLPVGQTDPIELLHWFEHTLMMAWPYSGEMAMNTVPFACKSWWLTGPSADAGWLL